MRLGHAAHPDWRVACELVLAQLGSPKRPVSRLSAPTPLSGLVYASAGFAENFERIIAELSTRRPDVDWTGACAPGVLAGQGEYLDEPALAALVGHAGFTRLPDNPALWPQPGAVGGLLLLANPDCLDLPARLRAAHQWLGPDGVFGGVVTQQGSTSGPARHAAAGASALAIGTSTLTRTSVGAVAMAAPRRITSIRSGQIETLDDRPALDVLLEDLGIESSTDLKRSPISLLGALREAIAGQGLLVGIADANPRRPARPGLSEHRLNELVGIDPAAGRLAVTGTPLPDERLVLCRRDAAAARTDLIRICTELRESLEADGRTPLAAHYVSCVARGERLFGSPGVETALIAHNLGACPLIGFFGGGEIGNGQLRGYSGVLTVLV